MAWTEAQQRVIDTRNKNLLVSAAAGSGKTAVLVERIISMISEGDNPMDIDHLLVVTFTNAAAAEMRERIGKAIEKKLQAQPDNLHLQKQMSLLQSAQITTIHSFCLYVIRNYFHRIDLDPSFKIAEESEITLMKSDVLSEILERWYEEGREDFHAFIESYSYSKSDTPVEDLILQLYDFSMSDPWPKEWLKDKRKLFEPDSLEALEQTDWMKELLQYVSTVLGDLLALNAKTLAITNEADGPKAYQTALLSDRNLLQKLQEAKSYGEYSVLFSELSFDRLSSKREEGVDPEKKERIKELREEIKKGLKDLAGQLFFQSPEEMLKDLQAVKAIIHVLFELTEEFMDAFAKKKEEKNLIDFNDLEHFALKILLEEDKTPSAAALELSELYEEILIDEYQDSNMVQETILQSISRERKGSPNRFMVGDVKQSIYKFRLAMPEIFMKKYETYSLQPVTEDGECNYYQRIDLDRNFRSRKVVLDYVNDIFEQIMQKDVGGIVYDEAASLKYGELYQEKLAQGEESRIAKDVEFILVTEVVPELRLSKEETGIEEQGNKDPVGEAVTEADDGKEDPEEAQYTKRELEARAIARKIRELTDPKTGMLVYDKELKAHRPATKKDIVILLRSMSGWSEVFVNTLMAEGISAYADTGTGYFQTLEIMTLLNVLRIIDNPRQDIPLTGVLYSPIVGLTSTELAMIRAAHRGVSMYSAVTLYAKEAEAGDLKEKLETFLATLNEFRAMVNHKSIHELIQLVLDRTGYHYIVMAMPGGERRKANIDMLIAQAVRFEKGSYSGLFHFIRYIEKLHKYEVDFGEAATAGEQDDTVRIMSIHKSKGLEFPIVFVAGMSKQFNTQDLRSKIVLHSELGVGPEYIDAKLRTKVPTLLKKVIQKKVQVENLGEEIRVLYVAMTRAREKLILTGYLNKMEELKGKDISYFELLSAKSYTDLVLPAMYNKMGPGQQPQELPYHRQVGDMRISVLSHRELLVEEVKRQLFHQQDKERLLNYPTDEVYHAGLREEIHKRLEYSYPYSEDANLKVKMTVSELKKLGQFVDEEQSVNLYEGQNLNKAGEPRVDFQDKQRLSHNNEQKINSHEQAERNEPDSRMTSTELLNRNNAEVKQEKMHPGNLSELDVAFASIAEQAEDDEATIPAFIRGEESAVTGTERGTLYHRVLELLDLDRVRSKDDLKKELERLVEMGRLSDAEIRMLKSDYIYKFAVSEVADRMRKAQGLGKLYKERQFVFGIPAAEVYRNSSSKELILIQGIIDVFFEENGELVLLDYKSDLVESEEELKRRYQVQLRYYRRALEQILKKPVKEMIIYSLPMAKEIHLFE